MDTGTRSSVDAVRSNAHGRGYRRILAAHGRGYRRILAVALIVFSLACVALSRPAMAQDPDSRVFTAPTAWWWYHGVSADFLSQVITNNNARIVDLEVEQTSPYRFSAVLVKNTGLYAKSWWWYYGLTVSELASKLSGKRILDLEVYTVNGQQRVAAVLVPNTGTQAKSWWWYVNVTPAFINARLAEAPAKRLIDIETYVVGGQRLYSAVMIGNTGADYMPFWWYYNVTPSFISAELAKGKQLVDIEPHSAPNTFTVIMVKPNGKPWWWYYGVTDTYIGQQINAHKARIVHLAPYTVNGVKRFATIMVTNQ